MTEARALDKPLVGRLAPQEWMIAPETRRVMQALQHDGGGARFVGGCVRNALCNRRVMDIDIATTLRPEDVIDRLDHFQLRHVPVGLLHGTVTAMVDGKSFEITTLRKDMRGHGRHADVLFTTDWRIDASRRDFTFNALYATMEGDVYDYFNGIEDLRLGRVQFIGDPEARIREDVLRILRYFRFLAHFGAGDPDPRALAACDKLSSLMPKLSVERVRGEIFRLLESDRCAQVWQMMIERRIVTHFLPEGTNVAALKRLVTLEYIHHGGAFPLRRIAALLDVTDEGARFVAQSLKLSADQAAQLMKMVTLTPQIGAATTAADVRRLVYVHGNDLAASLLLLSAAKRNKEDKLFDLYNIATNFRAPRFPVVGEDVMALGYKEGPEIGRVLGEVEQWWMAADFSAGRNACLDKLASYKKA